MPGIMYGIGVGPGDPELMTLKAVKRIQSCKVIAIPNENKEQCTAWQIVRQAVPEIEKKEILCLPMPMTKDESVLEESRRRAAESVIKYLSRGEDVGFITLGDVSIYSTYSYLLNKLWEQDYDTCLISGIPSFCAVSARLGMPLVSGAQELHIIPASYQIADSLKLSGVKVLMKAGGQLKTVKEEIKKSGAQAVMVENCGMPDEKVYYTLEEIPETAGYYSLLIVR